MEATAKESKSAGNEQIELVSLDSTQARNNVCPGKRDSEIVRAMEQNATYTQRCEELRMSCALWTLKLKTHNLCILDGVMLTKKNQVAAQKNWLTLTVDGLFRGFGQVVFCDNPLTGLLVLIALLVGDVYVGVLAFIAAISATFGSALFGVDSTLIHSGLMTYNSVLVGCCLGTFVPGLWFGYTFVFAVVYGFFSVVVQLSLANFLRPYSVPTLTMSFNLMALACLMITYGTSYVARGSLSVPATYPVMSSSTIFFDGYLLACSFPIGIAQVFFVNNAISGVIIWVGLAICSRLIAVAALVGSMCGAFVGLALGVASQEVYDGLWGYNSVLGCAAIIFFFVQTPRSACIAIICAVYCALVFGALKVALLAFGMPCFTLPFCVTTYSFLFLQNSFRGVSRGDLATLTTPEATCEFC